ncbi:hypothetical protein EVAR_41222_1 [Eumeta japonica]|uniref:Uncharacterized protein n=1 Tax=Eumeta variegata TaxID=151549 RepID=A0A4C1W4E1_EUMVA|nr:hypothetical protein EVAR_41222_1 [Eumeta japonica]
MCTASNCFGVYFAPRPRSIPGSGLPKRTGEQINWESSRRAPREGTSGSAGTSRPPSELSPIARTTPATSAGAGWATRRTSIATESNKYTSIGFNGLIA